MCQIKDFLETFVYWFYFHNGSPSTISILLYSSRSGKWTPLKSTLFQIYGLLKHKNECVYADWSFEHASRHNYKYPESDIRVEDLPIEEYKKSRLCGLTNNCWHYCLWLTHWQQDVKDNWLCDNLSRLNKRTHKYTLHIKRSLSWCNIYYGLYHSTVEFSILTCQRVSILMTVFLAAKRTTGLY